MSVWARFSPRICVGFLACLAGLVLAEGILRLFKPRFAAYSTTPALYEPHPRWGYRYVPESEGRMYRNFELDVRVRIDANGFHDGEHDLTDGGTILLALGDSLTSALHVPVPDTWTQVLQRELRESHDPLLDVVNLGIDGTGTAAQLAVLRDHVHLEPDVVLLAFYENDLEDLAIGIVQREVHAGYILPYQTEDQRSLLRRDVDDHLKRSFAAWHFDNSYLFRVGVYGVEGSDNLFRTNFVKLSRAGVEAPPPRSAGSLLLLEAALAQLRDLADEYGFKVLLVPVPPRSDPELSASILAGLNPSCGPVLDPLPAMQAALRFAGGSLGDLYWESDAHFNRLGNSVFGRGVAELVEPVIPPR